MKSKKIMELKSEKIKDDKIRSEIKTNKKNKEKIVYVDGEVYPSST